MRYVGQIILLAAMNLSVVPAYAAVKVENVKVQVFESRKEPVTITVPFWVAKAGAEISDFIKIDQKDIDIKKVLSAIENAPRLGTIMTIEEKQKKIVISIE